ALTEPALDPVAFGHDLPDERVSGLDGISHEVLPLLPWPEYYAGDARSWAENDPGRSDGTTERNRVAPIGTPP
ncbi:MAG: hypothetical protein KC586_03160, partial [Myxococcales bacterium]|nr:hypothetical protein [Myxococcales bacterium]